MDSSSEKVQPQTPQLTLKADHENRPVWVTEDIHTGIIHIFLEKFSRLFVQAYDFLITIAEACNRQAHLHEYKLTPASLFAAASMGMHSEDIKSTLKKFCKTEVVAAANDFIDECTKSYGKVHVNVKQNRYFIESADVDALQTLLDDEVISKARVVTDDAEKFQRTKGKIQKVEIAGIAATQAERDKLEKEKELAEKVTEVDEEGATNLELLAAADAVEEVPEDLREYLEMLDGDAFDDDNFDVVSFEIKGDHLEEVQQRCLSKQINYPLIAEYDFRQDTEIKDVKMDLKPTATLRPYQEKSLRKMFSRGRARSGIIVLPCGAGKTLTGIAAACTIRKRTLVLCTSTLAVQQWRNEFIRWADIHPDTITKFTRTDKWMPKYSNGVIICTYSILAYGGKRAEDSQRIVDFIKSQKWGLMILDEVQVAPAEKFRKILSMCACHCKLGLTATLVREDDKIKDLFFLIGPRIYEANWMDLQEDGHIAKVRCVEIWVPMTSDFYREYLTDRHDAEPHMRHQLRKHLFAMNPNKFRSMEYLIREHEERGDKIIVFSDNVFALKTFAEKVERPYIYGPTSGSERERIINDFKTKPDCNTIFCSRIADNSIDIPGANVLIQISSMGRSQRQEAQRLGRILRAKANTVIGEVNAFFYSVISQDTVEMAYNQGRQRFLMDQGYSYTVVRMDELTGFDERAKKKPFGYSTKGEELDLLTTIHARRFEDDEEEDKKDNAALGFEDEPQEQKSVKRIQASMSSWSGAEGMVYQQHKQSSDKKSDPKAAKRKRFN
eukprot:m.29408 g.29408  ORF g.29408 m.29408 type:complete len:781 (+) comp16091_c0_seq2:212-2554(+)